MFLKISLYAVLFMVLTSSVSAQEAPCLEPNSYVLNEVTLSEATNLNAEIAAFRHEAEKLKPEQAIVVVFGGKRSKVDEAQNLVEKIERELKITKTDYQRRYWVRDGGFRLKPTLAFLIRPLRCSDYSVPLPDFGYDQVEFDGFDKENTVVTNSADLWSEATEKPKPQCPPAARAVRACIEGTEAEVYVLVNAQGKVVFAKTIGGHPLIRAAAESNLKSWRLKPLRIGEISMNRSGTVRIEFGGGPDIVAN